MQKEKLFMAINIGQKSEESTIETYKRYIGISPVYVVAVNPTKAELQTMYPEAQEIKEQEYLSEKDGVKTFRVDFRLRTDPEWGNKIDTTARLNFFLANEVVTNKDQTKIQVIDNYGETCWVTKEQYKAKMKPDTSRVVGDYRPCHKGEADFYQFLKCWLNIKDSTLWNNDFRKWLPREADELKDCEISLNWDELMKGNIKEVKDIIDKVKDYRVKVCFGVKTTEDNNQYQDIYRHRFLKNSQNNYNIIEKDIKNAKQNGRYADTVYSIENLKEWKVEETQFTNTVTTTPISEADIFGNSVNNTVDDFLVVNNNTNTVPDLSTIEQNNDLPF